tara:strand:- start:557 stop:970 length:414 start_codon:yes stop_codon:yes gene_type:complete
MYINKAKAIKNYSNTEASANLTKNSFQIVETILIELKRSMKIVSEISQKKKFEENERLKRNSNFSRACTAIYALQTSLDFERGGKIAIQLFQVYEFCRKQLIKAFTKKDVVGIERAIKTLNDIITAWKELLGKNATV